MKTLSNYIVENQTDGKNGHEEKWTDEDTGETITIWIDDSTPSPKEIQQRVENSAEEYAEKCKQERQERKKLNLDELEDDVWNLQSQLKNLHNDFLQVQYDQEDEIGNTKSDDEIDSIAQKYGDKLNQITKKQQNIKKKLIIAQAKYDKAHKAFIDFRDKLWDIKN